MHNRDTDLEQELPLVLDMSSARPGIARILNIDHELEAMITDLYHRYIEHSSLYVAKGLLTQEGEDLVCTGIDGQRYVAPSWKQIVDAIRANPLLVEKVKAGFCDVLPVPFASSLVDKANRFRAVMQTHERYQANPGQLAEPKLWIFDDHLEEIVYSPKSLKREDHGGMTKGQYLNATKRGWQVVLVNSQDQSGPGIYTDRSAQSVLEEIQNDLERNGEVIMNLDTYLTFASALWARGIVVDDLNNNKVKGKLTLCAGTLHLSEAKVPAAGWNHIQRTVAIVPSSSQATIHFRVVRTCVPILQ